MPERYPDDATLLALQGDTQTGVEYIPTGRTPYHLEFRRLVQRTLLACDRASDLRVYQDGDLAIGVRPGRCRVRGLSIAFGGTAAVAVAAAAVTVVWLDHEGQAKLGATFPTDRTAFLPLARVTAGATSIDAIEDLRGEAFLLVPDLAALGVTATAARVNAALAGSNASVTAAALNVLTGGPASTADALHRHVRVEQESDGEAAFTLENASGDAAANVALVLSLPNSLLPDLVLLRDLDNGFLVQRCGGETLRPVGVVHAQYAHGGDLATGVSGALLGAVPIDGVVAAVVLSVGGNLVSSDAGDGIEATVRVNGVAVTVTLATLTAADGAGFRSTAQGDGVAAVIATDGAQDVQRGDVLTVDLTRTATGTVTSEARDVVVLVVIRAARAA